MAGSAMEAANLERGERRGSLGRALERLKAAMRRRRSSGRDVAALSSTADTNMTTEDQKDVTSTVIAPSGVVEGATATQPSTIIAGEVIDVDDGAADEGDEPLLPMFSTRSGISEDKAKILFEKYGLRYEPRRRSGEEPASKIRRVEKPVRIRVHWKCHECEGHFARDRTCAACGHRRCAECTRSPSKRVRELLDSAKQTQQDDALPQGGSQPEAASSSFGNFAIPNVPEVTLPQPLEKDDHTDEDVTEVGRSYVYAMRSRPRSGEDLVLRPKSQIVRRQCHKCETPFLPPSRTECESCEHTRCNLCPRWPSKSHKWPRGSPGDEQAPEEEVRMVKSVQRVYRKPRQRVRYTCDQCQAVFVDRPKRLPETPDPALLQAVSDRLAGYQSQPPEIAAAG